MLKLWQDILLNMDPKKHSRKFVHWALGVYYYLNGHSLELVSTAPNHLNTSNLSNDHISHVKGCCFMQESEGYAFIKGYQAHF